MKHATRKITGFGAALLLIAAIIYLHYGPSVLFRYKDRSAVDPADGLWVVLNPFRNRQPEYSANAFLKQLKEGKCEEAIVFVSQENRSDYCAREHKYRLISWTLANRADDGVKTVLHFQAYRSGYEPDTWGNVWITVGKKDVWQVTSFESWY